MRFFLVVLIAGVGLYAADAAFASGKYSKAAIAIGKEMALHFGISMRR